MMTIVFRCRTPIDFFTFGNEASRSVTIRDNSGVVSLKER